MPSNPLHEKERLAALRSYQILDTEAEPEYDEIAGLAAELCQVSMAMIAFADEKRFWIKSSLGRSVSEIPDLAAFCNEVIRFSQNPLVISDIHSDERFKNHPLVKDSRIVFIAAIPLISSEGFDLGTLCILDNQSHVLSDSQLRSLQILARQIIQLLECRKVSLQFTSLKSDLEKRNMELKQFSYVVSHDIKSPLASIVLTTEMLREHFGEQIDEDNDQLLHILDRSSLKIRNLAEGVQAYYRSESALNENAESVELKPFLSSVAGMFKLNQAIDIQIEEKDKEIFVKKSALELILVNLIQNAFKFNDKVNPKVQLCFSENPTYYSFAVIDNGTGMTPEEQKKIEDLFTTSDLRDSFGTKGSGMGLSTVKRIAERLSGSVALKSTAGKGSEFSFTIKKQK